MGSGLTAFPSILATIPSVRKAELVTQSLPSPDKFEFKAGKKYHWLQKICFKILDRIGCRSLETTTTVVYKDIQAKDLLDLVLKSIDAVYYSTNERREDLVVCIGNQEWSELISNPYMATHNWFSYSCGPFRAYDGFNRECSPFGVQVAVIPWMQGVVVVPRKAVANVV